MYIDELLSKKPISPEDARLVNNILDDSISSVEGLLQKISYILSKASGYTVFGCEKLGKSIVLDAVKIVKVDEQTIAVMIIDKRSRVYTELIRIRDIDFYLLNRLSEYLTNKYNGKSLRDLEKETFSEFEYRDIIREKAFLKVLYVIRNMEIKNFKPDIHIEGATNILNFPEFKDIIAIKSIISLMNDKNKLMSILLSSLSESIEIKIGSEHTVEGMENLAPFPPALRRTQRFSALWDLCGWSTAESSVSCRISSRKYKTTTKREMKGWMIFWKLRRIIKIGRQPRQPIRIRPIRFITRL